MAEQIKAIKGGVTAASGFSAAGIKAGIKASGNKDLGLVTSSQPCSAAGTFTTNAIRATSVDWCSDHLPSQKIRAILCNSGCANACTGKRGEEDNRALAEATSQALATTPDSILIASTGVIGEFLPMDSIQKALPKLAKQCSPTGGTAFATTIMTTDTRKKESAVRVTTDLGNYTLGGCTKGSGMIHPNMATMLAFITTDALITPKKLDAIVKRVVNQTFNNLTVDGDTSTNDMVLVLANGVTGYSVATKTALTLFEKGLYAICDDLCKQIAADGEGATKRVEIHVTGGASEEDAKLAARAVANSNLTKCALFGNDPNWGRIACAVGYSKASFSNTKMSISICGIPVFKELRPLPFDKIQVHKALDNKVVSIAIDLGIGNATAIAHTCDFSYDYVKINAEYHT